MYEFEESATTAIYDACVDTIHNHCEKELALMLSLQLPIDSKDSHDRTLLEHALLARASPAAIQLLLDQGADPNTLGRDNSPIAIIAAVRLGNNALRVWNHLCNAGLQRTLTVDGSTLLEFVQEHSGDSRFATAFVK
jgi:ankyrin repeat protein